MKIFIFMSIIMAVDAGFRGTNNRYSLFNIKMYLFVR